MNLDMKPSTRPATKAEGKPEPRLPRINAATDLLEKEDGFYIFMDLPGVSKEALVIDLNEDTVTVSGKVEFGLGGDERFIHSEFGSGEYHRVFTLAHTVDREKIRASLKNGVLELYLPKAEKAQPRKITIQAG